MELRQIVYRLANNTHTRLVTHISHCYTQICNMSVVWISSYSDREIRSLGQMMVDILFVCPPQQWPNGCQALEWILKVNVPALNMCMCMHNCANSSKLTSYVVYILLKMYQLMRVGVENRVKYWDNCLSKMQSSRWELCFLRRNDDTFALNLLPGFWLVNLLEIMQVVTPVTIFYSNFDYFIIH